MIYPIDADPLPLEWNITPNVNAQNAAEHLPYRPMDWYLNSSNVSTINAAFFMQGMCDPQQGNPNHPAYRQGCTDANNDLMTGGIVAPTDANYHIATKAKDISWMLKALFEAHENVKSVGIYFKNDGAGAVVRFPGIVFDGRSNYTSEGCDWMNDIHPRTRKPIGTRREIENCHAQGVVVNTREYNPLERAWCRDQVMRDIALADGRTSKDQNHIMAAGPYKDGDSSGRNWVLTFGQAVFDLLTNEFIACTLVDISFDQLYTILEGVTGLKTTAESALIRFNDEGTVLVATQWKPFEEDTATVVTDEKLNLGVDANVYEDMRNLVNYNEPWVAEEVDLLYRETIFKNKDRLIMTYPVPNVPLNYTEHYMPDYLVIISMTRHEAFGVLEEMKDQIEADVKESTDGILIVGGVGFGAILLSIAFISSTLTKPLQWMQKVAGTCPVTLFLVSCIEFD